MQVDGDTILNYKTNDWQLHEVADINQSFEESELCLAHQFEWNCKWMVELFV